MSEEIVWQQLGATRLTGRLLGDDRFVYVSKMKTRWGCSCHEPNGSRSLPIEWFKKSTDAQEHGRVWLLAGTTPEIT